MPNDLPGLTSLLESNGFLAAEEEAQELRACAASDGGRLAALVERRLSGEPLAWITGTVTFCNLQVRVDPGVYVPRWHSAPLARRAVERLPPRGTAIDLCAGTGAIAKVMIVGRPGARVFASDLDERAVTCARENGVQAYHGDLFEPLPVSLEGQVDVIVAVVPYVPTPDLSLLQRDTFTFESQLAYDGGADGAAILRRVIADSSRFLRPGGELLLELGRGQPELLGEQLAGLGYSEVGVLRDADGDVRGLEATLCKVDGRSMLTRCCH